MTEEHAFVRMCMEDPADDAVRLMYADWLEEHGRTVESELIRVRVALRGVDALGDGTTEMILLERGLTDRLAGTPLIHLVK